MASIPVYTLDRDEVYEALGTTPQGLSREQLESLISLYGPNVLSEPPSPPPWRKWLTYTTHPMALILWGSGIAALFSHRPGLGPVIFLVILINAAFSYGREYRAGKAVASLHRWLPANSRVIRDGGEAMVPASEIVPGDVLILAEGDRIPADARVIEESGLRVNNAVLTGETLPARRLADASLKDGLSETERPNLVYAGTSVFSGTGRAVVYATGMLTQFGRIANLSQAVKEEPSQLQRQILHISRVLSLVGIGIGLIVFIIGQFDVGIAASEALIMAIGIIVAVVPEGLVPTVTLTLAMAVQRLAQHRILVKRLSAVETLGTTSLICTDKSGTLTQNQMTVRQIWAAGKQYTVFGIGYEPKGDIRVQAPSQQRNPAPGGDPDLSLFFRAALLCNNSRLNPPTGEHPQWTCLGDQTEAALLVLALKGGLTYAETLARCPRTHELPFDARRKRMSTIHRCDGLEIALVKGAPREVLQLCTHIQRGGQAVPLDDRTRREILATNDDYARRALRVLALAQRKLPSRRPYYTPENVESGLTFLGLAAMMDPPRPEVAKAMESFHSAGIRVAMITGDYGLTAESVARRIGMISGPKARILTGVELDAMEDAELLKVLDEEIIFSRMAPEHKLRLVRAFQDKGEVVAVIGDGVNDTPALRKADIGIAMGITGTDVARDAADVILLEDNFGAVVRAIEEGRAVYDNLRKFITYIFASNVPEVLPFILSAMFNIPLALTVTQILAIDLGTDLLPALALGTEKPEPDVMQRPPRKRDQPLVDRGLALRAFAWLGALEAIFCFAGFFWVYDNGKVLQDLAAQFGWQLSPILPLAFPRAQSLLLASTVFHAGVVASQVGNAFACRSEKSHLHQLGRFSNPFLNEAVGIELVLILLMVYVPGLARVFSHYPLPPLLWLGLGLYAPGIYYLDRLRKILASRIKNNKISQTLEALV